MTPRASRASTRCTSLTVSRRMDGFVNAYAQKLTGREVVPKKQWFVIVPVALVSSPPADSRSWRLFAVSITVVHGCCSPARAIVAVVALYDTLCRFRLCRTGSFCAGPRRVEPLSRHSSSDGSIWVTSSTDGS